jgi:hypothetical protein
LYFSTTICICVSQQHQQHTINPANHLLQDYHDLPEGTVNRNMAMSSSSRSSRGSESTMLASLFDCMVRKEFTTNAAVVNEGPDSTASLSRTTTTTQPEISIAAPKSKLVLRGVSDSKTNDDENNDDKNSLSLGSSAGDAGHGVNETRRPKVAAGSGNVNVNVATVDVKRVVVKQLEQHPYWGARDEQGQGGHVHDPTVHRRPFTISNDERLAGLCDAPGKRKPGVPGMSIEGGEMGARALEKVQISATRIDTNPIRLFCAVYTHTGATEQTNALLETWAPRCDGLLLASNATNATTHHVHIPHKSVAEGQYRVSLVLYRILVCRFSQSLAANIVVVFVPVASTAGHLATSASHDVIFVSKLFERLRLFSFLW